jgi:hypothetical protein
MWTRLAWSPRRQRELEDKGGGKSRNGLKEIEERKFSQFFCDPNCDQISPNCDKISSQLDPAQIAKKIACNSGPGQVAGRPSAPLGELKSRSVDPGFGAQWPTRVGDFVKTPGAGLPAQGTPTRERERGGRPRNEQFLAGARSAQPVPTSLRPPRAAHTPAAARAA